MMVDGGSNANFTNNVHIFNLARRVVAKGSIGGIGSSVAFTHAITADANFHLGTSPPLSLLYTPSGSKNILSESILLDQLDLIAEKHHQRLRNIRTGATTPLKRSNGLYYVDVEFSAPTARPSTAPPEPVALTASVDDIALLWASRLGTNADELQRVAKLTSGMPIAKITPRMREAINASIPHNLATERHAPTHTTPLSERATQPAERLICDGWGKHHAASPIDSATYSFSAVCEYSSYGYIACGKTHEVDDWFTFLKSTVLDARARGHNPKYVRFDRAPELRTDLLKQRLENELNLIVELTPREHHEGVGRAERNHDLLTRLGTEMLQRANLDGKWLLPARMYAQWLINRRAVRGQSETRYQRYLRKVPDLSSPTPYIFGTDVTIIEDVHGPNGSLDHGRASLGKFVGVSGSSYLVWREKRQNVVHQYKITPLNELALVRSGLPAAVATAHAETQTDDSVYEGSFEPLTLLPTIEQTKAAAAKPPKQPAPRIDHVPVGTNLDVLWTMQGTQQKVWWQGKVTAITNLKNGGCRHHVLYPGYTQPWQHNLASDDFEWKIVEQSTAGPPAAPPAGPTTRQHTQPPPQPPNPPTLHSGPATRRRAAATATLAFVDSALEAASAQTSEFSASFYDEYRRTYNAALYQHLGDSAEPYECNSSTLEGLDAARSLLTLAASSATEEPTIPIFSLKRSIECSKATQNIIDVATELGSQQFVVPSTYRAVLASAQKEEWLAADQTALDAILAYPGNRLVSTSIPNEAGIPIARCVTQRKLKIDPSTKALARNGFKSRHCVDGGHLATMLARLGSTTPGQTSSSVADDMLIKLLVGDAANRRRVLTTADCPNAYPQAKRLGRPLTYMQLPETFKHLKDDDGSPLCIELVTPMWGEAQAGFEWQIELESSLLSLGWQRAENVPACWIYREDGQHDAILVTIVDDLLFSESSAQSTIAARTIKVLSEKYGDLRPERNPTSFVGYRIKRNGGAINLSMPQKISEAAREHLPQLIDHLPLDLPTGRKLEQMADEMKLQPLTPKGKDERAKLSRDQTRTQQLIGSLKFIERLHPRISLLLHRLSCIMSSPPPEAMTVARATLALVYAEKDVGLTFGSSTVSTEATLDGHLTANIPGLDGGAPTELESHADATWGDRNIYGLILTYAGAVVYHATKKIALIVDSSMESEAIASAKAGESVAYAREILRAFGVPPDGPTLIGTDNLANFHVATGVGCPSRSKHFLRRYFTLKRRIAEGEVTMRHIPDVQMPADHLTKFGISKDKVKRSVDYMTNRLAAPHPALPEASLGQVQTTSMLRNAIAALSDTERRVSWKDRP